MKESPGGNGQSSRDATESSAADHAHGHPGAFETLPWQPA